MQTPATPGTPTSPATAPAAFAPGTLSRDALSSLLYSGAVRAGTFGLSVAAARATGAVGAGALGVALQVVALASLVGTISLPYALTQHLSRTPEVALRRQLLRVSATWIAFLTVTTAVAIMLGAPALAHRVYMDETLVPILFACGPLLVVAAAFQWLEGAMQGLRRFGPLARSGAWAAGLDLVAGVAAAGWGVAAMLVSRTIVRALTTSYFAARWLRNLSPTGEPSQSEVATPLPSDGVIARSLLRFAAPTLAGGAVVLAGNAVLRMLLVRTSDLGEAGIFQAADSLAQGVTLVPLAASTAFMPAMAAQAVAPARETAGALRRGLQRVTGFGLPLCLLALGAAPWVMSNVFGRDFAAAHVPFVWMVCAYGAVGPSALFVAWLMGRGHPWSIVWASVAWVAVLLSVYMSGLVAPHGAEGAATANVVAYGAALALYTFVVLPRHSLPAVVHLPSVAVTVVTLAVGALLQLVPGVHPGVAAGGALVLALLVFVRFGLPSLAQR